MWGIKTEVLLYFLGEAMRSKWTRAAAVLFVTVTIISFQNCAPPQLACDGSTSTDCSPTNTPKPPTESSPTTPEIGGGNTSESGAISIPGGSSGGAGSSSSSGLTLPSSTTPSSGSSSVDYSNKTFRIVTPPKAVTVAEGAFFNLSVSVYGGTPPYKYEWFKDGALIKNYNGAYYSNRADRYSREGLYKVRIKDTAGSTVESAQVRLSIKPEEGPCAQGTYVALKKDVSEYPNVEPLIDMFVFGGKKYLISSKNDIINSFYSSGFMQSKHFSSYNTSGTIKYKGLLNLSCTTAIPNVHQPEKNPGAPYTGCDDYWCGSSENYNDGAGWKYDGTITFECVNNKFRLLSNSCKWSQVPQQDWGY